MTSALLGSHGDTPWEHPVMGETALGERDQCWGRDSALCPAKGWHEATLWVQLDRASLSSSSYGPSSPSSSPFLGSSSSSSSSSPSSSPTLTPGHLLFFLLLFLFFSSSSPLSFPPLLILFLSFLLPLLPLVLLLLACFSPSPLLQLPFQPCKWSFGASQLRPLSSHPSLGRRTTWGPG